MCQHQPPCPSASAPDHDAARAVVRHPDQGWSLLCNGVVAFDDLGDLLPDGHAVLPPVRTLRPAGAAGQPTVPPAARASAHRSGRPSSPQSAVRAA